MKHYQNILIALDSSGTPNAKQTKFAKLGHTSTDPTLSALCLQVARMYSLYPGKYCRDATGWSQEKRATTPIHSNEWRSMQLALNNQLRMYVKECLAQNKPEWMVAAEKHGWTPPVNL